MAGWGGGRGRGRGGAVRKLSPYDVFPASQRRFRRDTKGRGGESARRFCGSDGKQEEEESARAAHATRGEEKDRGWEVERLYLSLLCVSSADHIRRSGLPPPWTA